MESAESAADPAGVNNCFLSAGISVASSEPKLSGRRPLTRPQPPTCPNVPPQTPQTTLSTRRTEGADGILIHVR
ncbi:putative serine/threonine-protein kinase tsuA [Dissostichus eleginoides]|uniref:Serine/threonine-protein kinase tsuA n=1 Tax=Dissostichus eleginoides TaxID=100907 RepID=A0AAD9F4G5_DISEL|nr:putative serine/threonine-protein kinase tsuA [Dissostichus eleginoides]